MRIVASCHFGAALSTIAIACSCSGIDRRFEPAREPRGKRKTAVAPATRVTIPGEFVARELLCNRCFPYNLLTTFHDCVPRPIRVNRSISLRTSPLTPWYIRNLLAICPLLQG